MSTTPRFRAVKALLRPWFAREDWHKDHPLPPEVHDTTLIALVNPLFACLPEGGATTDRAAFTLGEILTKININSPDEAKNIVRRFIWHMNEESGNIGWGIPEAFGETLAQSSELCDAFHRVLFSYILDKPGDSTYCDYAPLRRSCYRAIGIVLIARPEFSVLLHPLLRDCAKHDPDEECRRLAASLFS